MQMDNLKSTVKSIIDKLTVNTNSVFSEKLYLEAGELGIGEVYVRKALDELQQDKSVEEVFNGKVIRNLSVQETENPLNS